MVPKKVRSTLSLLAILHVSNYRCRGDNIGHPVADPDDRTPQRSWVVEKWSFEM
eukprot:SAG31_NODE_22816_length_517_cov_0.863636_1_plen_53_part_10